MGGQKLEAYSALSHCALGGKALAVLQQVQLFKIQMATS
jgi:hypothetical protein